ncbi:MAG: hypothetical protein M3R04_05385 [bacterium]|nr:hypothetical protein [bacterium]
MREQIRSGVWKRRTCSKCSYFAFARGELHTVGQLRKRRDLKRTMCKRCPARGLLKQASGKARG